MPETRYAHQIEPHPSEGETLLLDRLVRYHYAQALAWHLSFAETIAETIDGPRMDYALAQYLGHSHLALLHDALAQGLTGQEAADWASRRHHSESVEIAWERAAHYGLNPDEIRPYATRRNSCDHVWTHDGSCDLCGHVNEELRR